MIWIGRDVIRSVIWPAGRSVMISGNLESGTQEIASRISCQ